MKLATKRLTVYLRAAAVVLVLGAIGVVLFKNRNYTVHVWFFGLTDASKPVNVVWVMVWTAGLTRGAWWVISFAGGLIRDYREVKKTAAAAALERRHQQRIADLDERERRIEEKLKRAAGEVQSDAGDADRSS